VGLIYSSADSQQLIKALKSNVKNVKETLDKLKSGSQKVVSAVDGKTLAGAAYTAGKGLFSELIIPTISKVTQAFDQLTQELQTFEAANNIIQAKGSYLNEDLIMQTIQIKKAQKQAALTSVSTLLSQITISDSPDMDAYIRSTQRKMNVLADNLSSEIRALEKKIEALQNFSSSTNSLFSQSLNNLNIAIQNVNVLNQTKVLDQGTYILPKGSSTNLFTNGRSKNSISYSESYMSGSLKSTGKRTFDVKKGNLSGELSAEAAGAICTGKVKGKLGIFNGSLEESIGKVGISGKVKGTIFQGGRPNPMLELETKAYGYGISGKIDGKIGNTSTNIHASGTGNIGYAEASGKLNLSGKGIGAEGKLEAAAIQGKVSGGFTVMGFTIDVSGKGKLGAIGGGGKFGVKKDEISIGADLSVLVGLGLDISIKW